MEESGRKYLTGSIMLSRTKMAVHQKSILSNQ